MKKIWVNAIKGSSNFVDVKDMKDEKSELFFDNVKVVAITTSRSGIKRRRRKRKNYCNIEY